MLYKSIRVSFNPVTICWCKFCGLTLIVDSIQLMCKVLPVWRLHKIYISYCLAACFGKGIYFAVRAEYSSQEIYSPTDENGHKYIYKCLVLTGEYTKGDHTMTVPPAKNQARNPHILYESLVNNMDNPTIFVATKDEQAYPEYLIVFKKKNWYRCSNFSLHAVAI